MRTIWKINKSARNYCGRPRNAIVVASCKPNFLEANEVMRKSATEFDFGSLDWDPEGEEENSAATMVSSLDGTRKGKRRMRRRRW